MNSDFKSDNHILSHTIIANAIINTICALMIFYCRKALAGELPAFLPVMQDEVIWNDQKLISAIQLAASAGIFIFAWHRFKRRKKYLNLSEGNSLWTQTSEAGKSVNRKTLSIQSTGELLEIWAAIILGVGIIYDVSADMYRRFLLQIGELIGYDRSAEIEEAVVTVYNGSHGFKYVGMFTAIILGIVVTSIFLKDKKLISIAAILTTIFMISFAYVNMQTVTISGNQYGIVLTSVLFHALETFGLLFVGIYLYTRYKNI